jgi:hypothetical protein
MNQGLEYGKIYDLKIKEEEYRGVYLGKRAPNLRLRSRHSMLIDRPSSLLWGFSLIGFNEYDFSEDNKLVLRVVYYISPSSKEKGNLEGLLKKFG